MPTLQQNLLCCHRRLLVSAILVVFWSFMTAVSSSPLSSSLAAAALTPRRHPHYEIGVDGALREIVIDNVPVVASAVEDTADGIASSSSSSASTTVTTIIVDKNKNYGLRGNNDNDDGTIYELEGTINRQKKVWDFITTFDEYKTSNLYKRANGGGRPVLTNVKYMIVPIYWKEEREGNNANPYTMDLNQLVPIMDQNRYFYDDMSWNQMNFEYEIIQQGQLSNYDISWDNPSFDDTSRRTRAVLDLELGYKQGEDYDSIELIYNLSKNGPFSDGGGWGGINGDFLWMSYPISLSVTRHEVGHNFGHPHHKTNSYEYRQKRPNMIESLNNGAGRYDGFDLMSGGNNVGNPGHFAAASKWFFGWIPDTSIVNIQPEGSTTECPNCVKDGTFRLFSFDDKSVPPTPSRKMAAHIPIAVDGNTLYSFWLSYQGSETYNGATSKGLSVHFSYFKLRKNSLYGCEYDSHRMYAITNDEDSGAGIDKTSSAFVAVDTCYVIPSSPYMKDRDPTAMEEIANPVVCVTNINEGKSIDVSVSFDDTNSNSNNNDDESGGSTASINIDNNNISKTTLDCSSSSTSIVEMEYEFNSNDDTSNLIHVINTGADADITLSLCTTSTDDSLSNVITSAFLYDEYPLSFIGYDSNPAYGSFKSVEVTSDQCSPTVSYQSDYDNTYILIPSSIESFVSVSCKQNSCTNNSYWSSETGKCKSCPPNHLSGTMSNDISDCVECSSGTYLSHPYAMKCTTDLRFQKITSSMQWRIWTTPQHIPDVDWAWDVQELEFYDNIGCTGTKIPTNTGTPIDSGNAGSGWTAINAFNGGAWGGRPNQNGVFYVGMDFQEVVTVKCINIQNKNGKAANEIRIQAFNTDTNKWENAWIARNLDTSDFSSNTISMDYPSDDRPPTPVPRPPPTPFPTLFPTPTPTLEPSKTPSQVGDTASTGWRIYTTPQEIPEVDWAWDVQELEFYKNLDCTTKISTNTGIPIDSGNAGQGWEADNAFGEGAWAHMPWGGRQDQNGVFWIGMSFQEVVTVKCIRIQNMNSKAANEIQIQAFNTNVNEWETVWIARGLDTSDFVWNTISLDFSSGDNPPTLEPTPEPTEAPIPSTLSPTKKPSCPKNSKKVVYVNKKGKKKKCNWVKAGKTLKIRRKRCISKKYSYLGKRIKENCPKACGEFAGKGICKNLFVSPFGKNKNK